MPHGSQRTSCWGGCRQDNLASNIRSKGTKIARSPILTVPFFDTRSKELVVNSACIVEEGVNDALDSFDAFGGEQRTVGFVVGELGELAVDNFAVLVWRELALGRHRMVVPF